MSVIVRSVVWCVVICILVNDANGVRPRKRKANDDASNGDEEMRKNRVLDDWLALSRPALNLVIQDLQLNPRGTTRELAERIFNHYNPQQQSDSPSQVQEDSGTGQNQLANTVVQVPDFSTHFNELREELYSVLATQVADITHTLSQQIAQINNVNTAESSQPQQQQPQQQQPQQQQPQQQQSQQIPINSAPQISPQQNQLLLPSQSPDVTPQVAALQQQQQQVHNNINNVNNHHTISNMFRMPVLSSQNLNLIKNGKFVNFDYLLPGSLAHTSSGYSIQFHQSAGTNGIDSDTPFSLQPQTGRRTIKSFSTWLSAWNIFFQAFCFFFPAFAGSLLAYQSQITIYANRYDFSSWMTYDRSFRQNMANTHPNSPWSEVDRHLFDEVLLCAPVLTVCHHCREPGHYHTACPSRAQSGSTSTLTSAAVQPFPAPQRTATPHGNQPGPRPSRPQAPRGPPVCRFFNTGTCTFTSCTFRHQCSKCRGSHPASRCPN